MLFLCFIGWDGLWLAQVSSITLSQVASYIICASETMATCHTCRASLMDGAIFCGSCGAKQDGKVQKTEAVEIYLSPAGMARDKNQKTETPSLRRPLVLHDSCIKASLESVDVTSERCHR